VFLPNFNVTNSQRIYPAADLSEQISTAGKEASGTGNMKFQMNGALTIGTMDGANIEIREEVGPENFFLFGLTAAEVQARRAAGYQPMQLYYNQPELREVLTLIRDGYFSRGNSEQFLGLVGNLLHHDPYMVLADYQAYAECQQRVDAAYRDPDRWTRMSILNTARSGKFSSDRSIREYCSDIWSARPVTVQLKPQQEVMTLPPQ
jgi:starch phosphorylase